MSSRILILQDAGNMPMLLVASVLSDRQFCQSSRHQERIIATNRTVKLDLYNDSCEKRVNGFYCERSSDYGTKVRAPWTLVVVRISLSRAQAGAF